MEERQWEVGTVIIPIEQRSPRWHVQGMVLAQAALGRDLDLSSGEVSRLFPHDENQLAIATALKGKQWVKYFLHVRELNEKVSATPIK